MGLNWEYVIVTKSTDILVDEWKKDEKNVVRVRLQMFRGKKTFSIRTWYRGTDGELQAGKNGINLPLEKNLLKVLKAIKKARSIAKRSD